MPCRRSIIHSRLTWYLFVYWFHFCNLFVTLVQRSLWLTSRTTFFEVIFRVRYWVSHVRRDQQICHRPYRVAFPPLLLYVDYHNGLHSIYFLHYGLRANYRAPHDKSVIKKTPRCTLFGTTCPSIVKRTTKWPGTGGRFFLSFFSATSDPFARGSNVCTWSIVKLLLLSLVVSRYYPPWGCFVMLHQQQFCFSSYIGQKGYGVICPSGVPADWTKRRCPPPNAVVSVEFQYYLAACVFILL